MYLEELSEDIRAGQSYLYFFKDKNDEKCKISVQGNGVARTLKKLRTPKGDYWIKQSFSSIAPILKWKLPLKERICSQRERILSFKSSSLYYGK